MTARLREISVAAGFLTVRNFSQAKIGFLTVRNQISPGKIRALIVKPAAVDCFLLSVLGRRWFSHCEKFSGGRQRRGRRWISHCEKFSGDRKRRGRRCFSHCEKSSGDLGV